MKKEALFYEKLPDKKARCFLCPHRCLIADGNFGICGVRKNDAGALFSFSYASPIALNIDPIEKKPLYHFMPGTSSLSLAAKGCNFRCTFCQNWQISQDKESSSGGDYEAKYRPDNIIALSQKNHCQSISYTYTEPTVFFEYARDIAKLAKKRGLANIFVTNGYISKEATLDIGPYLDAANIDLKSFSDDFYHQVCGGRLSFVLETIKLMRKLGIWVEITTLIVPGLNDSPGELKNIAAFIAGVDKGIPWHISKFHPDYKMLDKAGTPLDTLELAKKIGAHAGLRYIYIGNTGNAQDTICYNCNKTLIRRLAFDIVENNIRDNKCLYCNSRIDGVKLDSLIK